MFQKHEFSEWKQFDITQELMKAMAESATLAAAKILTRPTVDAHEDQYLKGMISAFSQVVDWSPAFIPDENHPEQDAIND